MSKLTEKQKAFADYYIESLNATDSYSKAYEKDNRNTCQVEGCKLLRNPKVKDYIDEVMASKNQSRIASQDEILQILTDIARGITEEEVVSFSNLGEECRTTRKPTIKDRMRASELLGKRYRMFTDKIEASIQQQVVFEGIDELED
ncbi:terminase small subunit [Clostridium sp.]|uniref:terminase small subunit n=1 Tax=Clostridium sp. TaxID=1506 RepID=UPI003F2AA04C